MGSRTRTNVRAGIIGRCAAVFLAAAAVAAPAADGTPPTSYTLVEIGYLPDTFSTVSWGINNDAHVVGWGRGDNRVRPFLWTPQTGITELPLPPGYSWGIAYDISDTGIIVGIAYNGVGTESEGRAWRMINGVPEPLPPFPNPCSGMFPTAVNDAGDVVGYTCPGGDNHAWFYSDDTGLIDLRPVGIAAANDISNGRVITGSTTTGRAFRWRAPAGRLKRLPLMPPPHDDAAVGVAINESREVTGYGVQVLTGPDAHRAFRYDDVNGLIPLVEGPGPSRSAGYGINEQGHVVGNSGTMSTPDQVAWLWTPGGGRVNLITLVNDPQIFGIRRGQDIKTMTRSWPRLRRTTP